MMSGDDDLLFDKGKHVYFFYFVSAFFTLVKQCTPTLHSLCTCDAPRCPPRRGGGLTLTSHFGTGSAAGSSIPTATFKLATAT